MWRKEYLLLRTSVRIQDIGRKGRLLYCKGGCIGLHWIPSNRFLSCGTFAHLVLVHHTRSHGNPRVITGRAR